MNVEQLNQFYDKAFPNSGLEVLKAADKYAQIMIHISDRNLRPGGTVSGSTMMELADAAIYSAVLASIGEVALAVTTNLNINFLSKPVKERNLVADCRLIKLGKRLAVGEVSICSEGSQEIVAHATGTYSIPPR